MPEDKSLDIFGIKPGAEAINTVVKASTDGAGAFLSRICLPAAEEIGLLLRDKVRSWRAINAVKITNAAEAIHIRRENADLLHAHPRVVGAILENGSWSDDQLVQKLWAGLLATSCTPCGSDQSNLMFVDVLSKLTHSQVVLLEFACVNAKKSLTPGGWLGVADPLVVPLKELLRISGIVDMHQLDLELDHLRQLGLLVIVGGFDPNSTDANLSPSLLALSMYARGNGFAGSVPDFFCFQQDATLYSETL